MSEPPAQDSTLEQRVAQAIDSFRPYLQADGGDIDLVEVVDDIAKVRLRGACAGCPMSQMTLKNGVERYVRQHVPEIKAVEAVA